MVEGWNQQRSYGLEGARIVAYAIAATNRDPKKSFPKMTEFLPLPTDEVQTKEDELIDTYNMKKELYKKYFPKTYSA